jgi:hypothetical protein
MTVNSKSIARLTLAGGLALTIGALAGCNSGGSSASPASSSVAKGKGEASAIAGSGTTKLTEADAQKLADQCLPGTSTTDPSEMLLNLALHKSARQTLLTCVKIPRAQWQAAGNCLITNYHAHPLPKPDSTVAEKQARHQAAVNIVVPCVMQYHQGGASPAVSNPAASASATRVAS